MKDAGPNKYNIGDTVFVLFGMSIHEKTVIGIELVNINENNRMKESYLWRYKLDGMPEWVYQGEAFEDHDKLILKLKESIYFDKKDKQ